MKKVKPTIIKSKVSRQENSEEKDANERNYETSEDSNYKIEGNIL